MSLRRFFLAAVATTATLAVAHPASALAPRVSGKSYSIVIKVTSGTKLTAIVITAGGRQIASKAITTTPQTVTLTTSKVASIKGATLHFVNSANASVTSSKEGDYFGPAVLSWYGTSASSATKVYRRLKASTSSTINLGSVTVKKITNRNQGYAIATSKQTEVDTSNSAATRAIGGKPLGVGTYGKSSSTKVAAVGVSSDVRALATADFPGDSTLGGDIDDDGIPNAFDVNDDGDSKTDSADSSTPRPVVDVDSETSGSCASTNFRIFTNFKATQPGFAGSINNYVTGDFKADATTIPDRISRTMSMVFSPIASVCGSAVTHTYLKGVGVPYAPSTYVELDSTCSTGDYQWIIGEGKMCANPDGSGGYSFGTADYPFSMTDLPSGQDTFSMKVTTANGNTYEFVSSAGFVFITHPMLAGFCVGATDGCATAESYTLIDYESASPGLDGSQVSYTMSVNKGDFLFMKVYRPQRLAIDGETAGYYDLGGFRWSPDIPNGGTGPGPGKCDTLTTVDTSADTLSDATSPRVVTLKWDINSCYVAKSATWTTGSNDFDIMVEPSGPGGNSAQKVRLQYTDGG